MSISCSEALVRMCHHLGGFVLAPREAESKDDLRKRLEARRPTVPQ